MRPVIALAIATGIYVLALGIIIPILPFQILSLGGSQTQATLIYSVFSGVSVLTLRFWGQMSDRFGRTPILWLSVSVTALSYLWLAYATSLWEVYAARALAGVFAAWLPVSQAFISDVIPSEKRAPAMGLLGVGFGLGFTVGPALGGYLSSTDSGAYDFFAPFCLAAAVSVLTLVVAMVTIKEPDQLVQPEVGQTHSLFNDRPLLWLLLLYFGVSVIFTGIEGVLAVWGEAKLDWQPKDVGYLLMIAGFGSIIAQGFLIRLATKRLREAKTVLLGMVGLALSILLLAYAQTTLLVTISLFFVAIFMGLHNPAMQSLISQIAPEEFRGKILGIAQATASLARVLGPLWAGMVLEAYGGNSPYIIASLMAVSLLVLGLTVLRPHFRDKNSGV